MPKKMLIIQGEMKPLLIALMLGLAAPRAQAETPGLAGLWSLNLSADLAWMGGDDLLSFYPQGALGAPARRAFPGFGLGLRRHLSDSFFVGAQLASLPKGYWVERGADKDSWAFDGLQLGAGAGWVVRLSRRAAVYAEAQVGWLSLVNGSLERSGANATTGSLEGSALSQQLGLGLLGFILPSVALEAQGGYRFARLPLSFSTKAGRQSPPSAPEFYADFSGPFARLGLSFFWGLRNPWGQQAAPEAPAFEPPPPGQD